MKVGKALLVSFALSLFVAFVWWVATPREITAESEKTTVEKKKTPPPPKNYREVVMLKSGKLEHIKLPTYGRWYSAKVDGRCLFAIYLKDGTGPLSLMDPSGPHNCMVDGPDCQYYIGDSMFSFEDISHVEYRLGPKADGFPQGVTVKVQVGRY